MTQHEDEVSRKWQEIEPQIQEIIARRKKTAKTVWFNRPLSYAAIISLIIIASSVLYISNLTVTTTTKADQSLVIVLPDESVVTLNEGSKLTYPKYNFWFKSNRDVILEGEAFFQVHKDSLKPFQIHSPHLTTKVLGTSFNLLDFKNTSPSLLVVEGKVRLTHNNENMIVTGGEEAHFADSHLHKIISENHNALAWKTGLLVFKKEKILTVVNTLQKYYKRKFIIKDKSILTSQFSGTFKEPTLSQFLEAFEYTMGVQATYQGQDIILTKKEASN